MNRTPRAFLCSSLLALLLVSCFCGCSVFDRGYRYVSPTVTVIRFENKAPFPLKWQLGDGMTDLMESALMETERFTVIERADMGDILRELQFQHGSSITRPEGKAPLHRIKNVKYIIKGVITDFTHVAGGGFGVGYKAYRLGGGGNVALVAMVVTVIDVETGEILLSETVSGKAYAANLDVAGLYEGVAFGGQAFYKTPLGKATQSAMRRAIKRTARVIAKMRWGPIVNSLEPAGIIVNGGKDRRLKPGTLYYVVESGKPVFDRETGNFLGITPGREIGIVEITQAHEKYSFASLRRGSLGKPGYRLRRLTSKERSGAAPAAPAPLPGL